ncbi:MAG TPA: hypothetical protein VMH81_23635 [Bryobacteraceae bacterium]|nr:hypothetical protein [Bryobacteraceae bacterium]
MQRGPYRPERPEPDQGRPVPEAQPAAPQFQRPDSPPRADRPERGVFGQPAQSPPYAPGPPATPPPSDGRLRTLGVNRRAVLGIGAAAAATIFAPRLFRAHKDPPVITRVDPPTWDADTEMLFTIDGRNFQPTLTVRQVLNGRVSPFPPAFTPSGQPRIQYLNPSRVLLRVRINSSDYGFRSSSRNELGFQFINPDGQESNIGY